MRNNPTALPVVYGSSPYYENTMGYTIILDEEVDPQRLALAVERAIKRFPKFAVQIIKDDDDVFHKIVPNDRPIVITEGKESPPLLSKEANYHFFTVNYEGNRLNVNLHHLISDGTGFNQINRTLLYYYFKEEYGDIEKPESLKTLEVPIAEEELRNPLLDVKGEANPEFDEVFMPSQDEFTLLEDGIPFVADQTLYKIILDEQEVIDLCRSMGASPTSLFTVFMAQVIYRLHENLNKNFRIETSFSYRPFIGKPDALDLLVGAYPVVFTPKLRDWETEDLVSVARGRSVIEMEPQRVLERIKNEVAHYEDIYRQDNLEDIIKFSQTRFLNQLNAGQITYMRNSADIGEFTKHIKEHWVNLQAGPLLGVVAVSLNGKIFISFLQGFPEDVYMKEFVKILEENGLTVELKEKEDLIYPHTESIF